MSGLSILRSAVLAAALLGAEHAAWAGDSSRMHCFASAGFENWRAPDTKTVYLRADAAHFYRIDLARDCSTLRYPDARLVLSIRGGHLVCSAVDMELKASEGFGDVPEPCFIKAMTELSPAEAAALPAKFKP